MKRDALSGNLFTRVFLPVKILSARRKFTPVRTSRSVSSWGPPFSTTQSTLDPTSWSKMNPTHNRKPPPPKVCRQETAIDIHHFISDVSSLPARGYTLRLYLLLLHIFQSNTSPQNNWFLWASAITKYHECLTLFSGRFSYWPPFN